MFKSEQKPILREILRSDLETLRKIRNSKAVMPFCREYRLLTEQDQENWWEDYSKNRRKSDFGQEIMAIEYRGKVCGAGGFTRIDWKDQKAELTFYIEEESQEEGVIVECLNQLIWWGFFKLNFHKIYWPVYGHDKKVRIYKKVFDLEAVLKEEYYHEGAFFDRVYLSRIRK